MNFLKLNTKLFQSKIVKTRRFSVLHVPKRVQFVSSAKDKMKIMPCVSELKFNTENKLKALNVGVFTPTEKTNYSRDVLDSYIELHLPFRTEKYLRDTMKRHDGSIRLGLLFEILDALAADVAHRHTGYFEKLIVTALVEQTKENKGYIDVRNDLILRAYVSHVGNSAIEVSIDQYIQDGEGDGGEDNHEKHIGCVEFIMVAKNIETEKAEKVPTIEICSDTRDEDEKLNNQPWLEEVSLRIIDGPDRMKERKTLSSESLSIKPPQWEEAAVMHSLYLKALSLKKEKNEILKSHSNSKNEINLKNSSSDHDDSSDNINNNQNNGGNALVNNDLDSIPGSQVMWMKDTCFNKIELMHPQNRNTHETVFGGFIMREAFELAWITAVSFFGTPSVHFSRMDRVQFKSPMRIGSVVSFESVVCFTNVEYDKETNQNVQSAVVQVRALEVDYTNPDTLNNKKETNKLTFVFQPCHISEDGAEIADTSIRRQVMPKEYDQFVKYLEGRRLYTRLLKKNNSISDNNTH